MIELQKCIKNKECVMLTLDGHISIVTEEDQKYFVDWIKKEKPEMFK